jgi:PAS domain S-box-containing protein
MKWPNASGEMAARISDHDWSATVLGAMENWPVGLRTAIDIMLALPQPATILWGAAYLQFYNDAYIGIAKDRHPQLLGRPVADGWPEVYDAVIAPLLDEARAARAVQLRDYVVALREPDGSLAEHVFDTSWSPLFDHDGQVSGVLQTLFEVTGRRSAEAALRSTEARLVAAFESVPVGAAVIGLDGKVVFSNSEFRRFLPTGIIPSRDPDRIARWRAWGMEGRQLGPDNFPAARALRGESVTPGQEMLYVDDNGREIWTSIATAPTCDEKGNVTGVVATISDIDDAKRSAEALRESEERLRSAVEVGRLGLWDWNVLTGEVHWSDEHFRMEGYRVGEVKPSYSAWAQRIHPDDLEGAEMALRQARATHEEYVREFRVVHPDGSIHWLYGRGRFIYDDAGEAIRMIGAVMDITERRESAERQKMLLAELQHRVRNILAVIRSIISRSDNGDRPTEEYIQHLQGRISALARTQVLLTRKAGAGVDLEYMIRDELLAQAAQEGQIELEGPDVELSPKAAEVLTLSIHELATNANKYGAFTRPSGRLQVHWKSEMRKGEQWLVLHWVERGVPVLDSAPRRKGFGSELISRRIPYELKGKGSITLKPGGLESCIEFPLRPGDSILQPNGAG